MSFCGSCGAQRLGAGRFCASCGRPFPVEHCPTCGQQLPAGQTLQPVASSPALGATAPTSAPTPTPTPTQTPTPAAASASTAKFGPQSAIDPRLLYGANFTAADCSNCGAPGQATAPACSVCGESRAQ